MDGTTVRRTPYDSAVKPIGRSDGPRSSHRDRAVQGGRRRGAIAYSVWLLVAGIALTMAWRSAGHARALAAGGDVLTLVDGLVWGVVLVLSGSLGALIVSRRSANVIGWLLVVPALAGGASALAGTYLEGLRGPPAPGDLVVFAAVWFDLVGWIGIVFPVLLLVQLFPTGRMLGGAWRSVPIATVALIVSFLAFGVIVDEFAPISVETDWAIPNPIGFVAEDRFPLVPWTALLAAVTVGSVATITARYRRSAPDARAQLRWLLYAGFIFVAIYVALILTNPWGEADSTSWLFALALPLAIAPIPLAVAAAIFRYRLWDIDIVIRRTLVYAPLTAIMAGIFSASVGLTQRLFGSLTGGSSELSSVMTTVIVVAAFDPIRRALTRFVDARFKEASDPRARWREHGATLAAFLGLHDPDVLARRLLDECVAAFDVVAGRIDLVEPPGPRTVHAVGAEDGAVVFEQRLEHAGLTVGWLRLGSRRNARPYDVSDLEALGERCTTVAAAIDLARSRSVAAGS